MLKGHKSLELESFRIDMPLYHTKFLDQRDLNVAIMNNVVGNKSLLCCSINIKVKEARANERKLAARSLLTCMHENAIQGYIRSHRNELRHGIDTIKGRNPVTDIDADADKPELLPADISQLIYEYLMPSPTARI
jgi:hypothetical protein